MVAIYSCLKVESPGNDRVYLFIETMFP